MSARSASRGSPAARSIRLALRTSSIVAISSASFVRWVLRWFGSRRLSSELMLSAISVMPFMRRFQGPPRAKALNHKPTPHVNSLPAELIDGKPAEPTFAELFTPKLVTILREGYGLHDLRADVIAGLTVAIVALPLSMAIAIASGTTPDRGLYAAIVGGFLVSLLGGSRFQIGGPAGAFIVLVAATVERHGVDGLLLATIISGVFLLAIGYLRLGTFIKYIPYPVTIGFTAGIAVIVFASQLKELLGLKLDGKEPGALIPKLAALAQALPTLNVAAAAVTLVTVG